MKPREKNHSQPDKDSKQLKHIDPAIKEQDDEFSSVWEPMEPPDITQDSFYTWNFSNNGGVMKALITSSLKTADLEMVTTIPDTQVPPLTYEDTVNKSNICFNDPASTRVEETRGRGSASKENHEKALAF